MTGSSRSTIDAAVAAGAFFAALAVRGLVLATTYDVPGDGPVRAMMALSWSRSPRFETHGVWLPGFLYLSGAFTFLVPDPWMSARILNAILGSLTVPVLYLLATSLFGRAIGAAAAASLAFLPLHVGLSASSLTEASAVFEILAAEWLWLRSAPAPLGSASRVAALSLLVLAAATRYEVWPLLLVFPLHQLGTTRRLAPALASAAILAAFPVFWIAGNFFATRSLPGLTIGLVDPSMGPQPTGPSAALSVLAFDVSLTLGWLACLAMAYGFGRELHGAATSRLSPPRVLHLAVTVAAWLAIFAVAWQRGPTLWNRHVLLPVALALPYLVSTIASLAGARRAVSAALVVLGVGAASLSLSSWIPPFQPPLRTLWAWVRREEPRTIGRAAEWIAASEHRDRFVVLTKMGWASTYFLLYRTRGQSWVVSEFVDDGLIRAKLTELARPFLLVTERRDRAEVERIERAASSRLRLELLHDEGGVEIYLASLAPPGS